MREIECDLLGRPEDYGDVRFRFIDTLHLGAVSTVPMPFDYQASHLKSWFVRSDDKGVMEGLDFGVVFLRTTIHSFFLLINSSLRMRRIGSRFRKRSTIISCLACQEKWCTEMSRGCGPPSPS